MTAEKVEELLRDNELIACDENTMEVDILEMDKWVVADIVQERDKWKKEAERLSVIVEWLREQCLDSRLT